MVVLIGSVTVLAVLLVAVMPALARRRMSANVARYLHLRRLSHGPSQATTPSTPVPPGGPGTSQPAPDGRWTALDEHQLTRLLRDSSH